MAEIETSYRTKFKLNFSGVGSGFNTDMGNTAAFIQEGAFDRKRILMIDCGESTFTKMDELGK